ncbi:hypothetical protein GCM10020000_27430 [Streptomyces olivoverticillatus]
MISFITSSKMTDRQVFAARSLGVAPVTALFQGTGLSGAVPALPLHLEERPTKASAVTAAAQAQAQAYAPRSSGQRRRFPE